MTLVSADALRGLVEFGSTPDLSWHSAVPRALMTALPSSAMRSTPEAWLQLAARLTDQQLGFCIRALTVLERSPGYLAGSVSPVIWLFRAYAPRCSREEHDCLAEWVLKNTENQYLPFGTSNFGAKSLPQLAEFVTAARGRREARRSAEEQRRLDAQTRKSNAATAAMFGAIRRRDRLAISALLAKGADVRKPNESGLSPLDYATSLGLGDLLTAARHAGAEGAR